MMSEIGCDPDSPFYNPKYNWKVDPKISLKEQQKYYALEEHQELFEPMGIFKIVAFNDPGCEYDIILEDI